MAVKPLTEEQRQLVSDNYELCSKAVAAFVRSGRGHGVAYDELESEALVAICEAAQRYEPDRGVEFPAYAWGAVKGHLHSFCCDERQKSLGALSLDDPAVARAADEANQVDGREVAGVGDDVRMFKRAVGALSPDEVRVLAGRSVGVTQADIAERMGVTERTIKRTAKRGMEKIRNYFVPPDGKIDNTSMRGIDSSGATGTQANPL